MTHPFELPDKELREYCYDLGIALHRHEYECADDCCSRLARGWDAWRQCWAELQARRRH